MDRLTRHLPSKARAKNSEARHTGLVPSASVSRYPKVMIPVPNAVDGSLIEAVRALCELSSKKHSMPEFMSINASFARHAIET